MKVCSLDRWSGSSTSESEEMCGKDGKSKLLFRQVVRYATDHGKSKLSHSWPTSHQSLWYRITSEDAGDEGKVVQEEVTSDVGLGMALDEKRLLHCDVRFTLSSWGRGEMLSYMMASYPELYDAIKVEQAKSSAVLKESDSNFFSSSNGFCKKKNADSADLAKDRARLCQTKAFQKA